MGQKVKVKYLILGGGLSGIGAAKALQNYDHLIVEKNDYLLGHANSEYFMEHFFDYGTHICHSKNNEWLDMLNKKNVNHFKNSDVKNYDNGNWIDKTGNYYVVLLKFCLSLYIPPVIASGIASATPSIPPCMTDTLANPEAMRSLAGHSGSGSAGRTSSR